jgi:hypothetical protein
MERIKKGSDDERTGERRRENVKKENVTFKDMFHMCPK